MSNQIEYLTDAARYAMKQRDLWISRSVHAQRAVKYWEDRADAYAKSIACLSTTTPIEMIAEDRTGKEILDGHD